MDNSKNRYDFLIGPLILFLLIAGSAGSVCLLIFFWDDIIKWIYSSLMSIFLFVLEIISFACLIGFIWGIKETISAFRNKESDLGFKLLIFTIVMLSMIIGIGHIPIFKDWIGSNSNLE